MTQWAHLAWHLRFITAARLSLLHNVLLLLGVSWSPRILKHWLSAVSSVFNLGWSLCRCSFSNTVCTDDLMFITAEWKKTYLLYVYCSSYRNNTLLHLTWCGLIVFSEDILCCWPIISNNLLTLHLFLCVLLLVGSNITALTCSRCVHVRMCSLCYVSPFSAQTYTSSPSDDIPERWTDSSWPSRVNLLNEISAPLTRALVLSPFARSTGMTFDPVICEQPPSSSKWRPLSCSRPCLSWEDRVRRWGLGVWMTTEVWNEEFTSKEEMSK